MNLTPYQQLLFDENVKRVETQKMGEKTTVCLLKLYNGFEVTGTSACVNPKDFDEEIGQHYALVEALKALDGYAGYARQEVSYNETTISE